MASYIEGVIRSILVDTAAVNTYCSTRVYWGRAPQKPTVPFIVFFAISDLHQPMYLTADGSGGDMGQRMYQFSCISDDSIVCQLLQQAVMDTLRWAQGLTYGFTIENINIENMRQRIDPVTDLFVCDVDATVEYYEA